LEDTELFGPGFPAWARPQHPRTGTRQNTARSAEAVFTRNFSLHTEVFTENADHSAEKLLFSFHTEFLFFTQKFSLRTLSTLLKLLIFLFTHRFTFSHRSFNSQLQFRYQSSNVKNSDTFVFENIQDLIAVNRVNKNYISVCLKHSFCSALYYDSSNVFFHSLPSWVGVNAELRELVTLPLPLLTAERQQHLSLTWPPALGSEARALTALCARGSAPVGPACWEGGAGRSRGRSERREGVRSAGPVRHPGRQEGYRSVTVVKLWGRFVRTLH